MIRSEQNHTNYKFLDLTGGVKPYLLNGMDNNIGAVTRIEYASSTKFAIADREGGLPWQTHLPFPVQVVERVEISDPLSKGNLVTRYAFHHGFWDGAEREFRGFGMVEQYDAETFTDSPDANLLQDNEVPLKHYSPPILTRTWFHQGPIGDEFQWSEADYRSEYWSGDPQLFSGDPQLFSGQPADFPTGLPRRAQRDALRTLQGNILRTERYSLDNTTRQDRPYTVTEHLYGVREESSLAQGQNLGKRVFFPYPLGQRTTQWERGDDPLTRYEFTNNYDDYGQPRQQTSIALPRRSAKRQPPGNGGRIDETRILATHIHTEYAAADPGLYINNRIAHLRTFELENPLEVIESDASDILSVLKDQAAAAQALHEQFQTLPDQWQPGQALPPGIRLIGHVINHYDGDSNQAFTGRRPGVVGPYGALTRSESLILTDAELAASYGDDRPSYLGGNSLLPEGGPADFGLDLGYRLEQGLRNGYLKGYYSDTKRQKYDFQESGSANTLSPKRGIIVAAQDALGHITSITPDAYGLLSKAVTDPVGLITTVDYDYRVLQPREVTDPNGNRTSFSFTPLGLLEDKWVRGKYAEGDQQHPSLKLSYNFSAYMENKQPVNVRTLRRVYHDTETDVPLPERDETIQTIEYSDGFGRLLQTRTQSENIHFGDEVFGGGDQILPANQAEQAGTPKDIVGQTNRDALNPNVVVNGWQVYDNKGQVVEKYEPFYSLGWNYSTPADCLCGEKATMYYDPLGRMFRTVNPDTSELLVVHGIPFNLADPAQYAPSPWETYTYDANDNAGRTLTADSRAAEYQHHWNTPASAITDALGRTITTIERNRDKPGEPLKPAEDYISRFTYDVQGNLLTVTDALGRVAFKYEYDLIKRLLHVESLDAGTRLTVLDAIGNPVEQRDSKGSLLLRTYDLLNRPQRLWARNDINSPLTLRERLEYGDGSDPNQLQEERTASQAMNRLARLSENYDEAGLLSFKKYDFKGNTLIKLRRVIKDGQILNSFNPSTPDNEPGTFCVDWEPPSGVSFEDHILTLLDPAEYKTSFHYDALNRVKTMSLPKDAASSPELSSGKILHPCYNRAGNLESLKLDDQTYIEHIAYNAKGQRTFIAYGNNVLTRYAYHPQTFRLVRMRTELYTSSLSAELTYQPTGGQLQDFAYRYDLAGNILSLHNRTPECGVRQADTLDRQFIYDAVYRLISATGREEDLSPPPEPWGDKVYSTDPTLTRGYSQSYSYDPSGNMVELNHQAGTANCYKRLFNHVNGSNRLSSVKFGNNPYTYQYDLNGNISKENTERHFAWDHSDRLITFTCRPSESTISSLKSHYLYDASGQRVKKLVQKQGGEYEVTVYIDGIFEYHRLVKGGEIRENNTLHVMDNQNRIAMVRVGAAFPNDEAPEIIVKYQLPDHLGSSNVVIGGKDGSANHFINCEEYYPYGETSFGSFAHNRYRFTGKERDEESGLYYHGARYYAPWLTRWISCDPEKTNAVCSKCNGLYVYGLANPLITVDPNGREDIIVVGTQVYSAQLKNPANKFNFMHQAIRSTKTMPSGATVLLFTEGYTKEQIDKFTTSIEMNDGHVLHLSSAQDLVDYINRGLPDKYGQGSRKQDPVRFLRIFSHGLPGEISFGFQLSDQDKYTFNEYHVKQLDPKAFAKNASIHSYACRTAAPVIDNSPEENLAQWIADQTKAETSAFEYRTTYEGSLGFEGLIGADQQSVQESMARQIMVDGYPFDPEGAVVGVYSQHGPMKTYLPRNDESQQKKELTITPLR